MLSRRSRYAAQAVLDISLQNQDKPVLIHDVAVRRRIPLKYLQHILLDLKQAGLVASRKGPGGGYQLAKAPEAMTLGEILRAVDGPTVDFRCSNPTSASECGCPDTSRCAIRHAFTELNEMVAAAMEGVTVSRLRDLEISFGGQGWDYVI